MANSPKDLASVNMGATAVGPMRSSFLASLLVLTWVSVSHAGAAAPRDLVLNELLRFYVELGLPLPPRDAKLARWEYSVGDGFRQATHGLALLARPATESAGPLLYLLFQDQAYLKSFELKVVAPKAAEAKNAFPYEDDLLFAIQCHILGWHELAQALFSEIPTRTRRRGEHVGESPRQRLVQIAWDYWVGQLSVPESDRRPAAWRLRTLLALDSSLGTESNKALMRSIDLCLAPRAAPPGSVEALVDDLVDSRYHSDSGDHRYWRVAERGFAAVPALIAHLDDERLTRGTMFLPLDPFHSVRVAPPGARVKDVVSALLEGLAGSAVRTPSNRPVTQIPEPNPPVTRIAVIRWWLQAQKTGEEAYLVGRVLGKERTGWNRWYLADILVVRYPKYIPAVYDAKAERRLLIGGMQWWRGLEALARSDNAVFSAFLLKRIQETPKYISEKFAGCSEAHYAALALKTGDPRIWEALDLASKRVELGVCMEFLGRLGDPQSTGNRKQRLDFLAGFLHDSRVRDRNRSFQYEGACAGSEYEKIEVRNFAALQIAGLLGINVPLDPQRSPEDWSRLRARVREDLKR